MSLELLRRAGHAPLATVLAADKALVAHFVRGRGDFHEGVRCVLIERGRVPAWKYARVEEVGARGAGCWFGLRELVAWGHGLGGGMGCAGWLGAGSDWWDVRLFAVLRVLCPTLVGSLMRACMPASLPAGAC